MVLRGAEMTSAELESRCYRSVVKKTLSETSAATRLNCLREWPI